MPFTPRNTGSTSIVTNINTNDLENARTAEITPFDNAVNIPLAKILKPIKSNATVQILFPVTARLYTGLPGRANTATKGFVSIKERIAVITEITAIIFRLDATSFFLFPIIKTKHRGYPIRIPCV